MDAFRCKVYHGDDVKAGLSRMSRIVAVGKEIELALGRPRRLEGDAYGDGRIAFEWFFDCEFYGEPICMSLYEYKGTSNYDIDLPAPVYFFGIPSVWSIGATRQSHAEELAIWLGFRLHAVRAKGGQ